jgi:hypothetical protein
LSSYPDFIFLLLKTIGVLEEKVSADISAAQQVPVVIEIQEN